MSLDDIAKNLRAFKEGVDQHDQKCSSPAYGIGLAYYDMERLGFEEAENLWGSIKVYADAGQSSNFRVLCNGNHNTDNQQVTEAVANKELQFV